MEQNEIERLRNRIFEDSVKSIDGSSAMEHCTAIRADGSWNDIDYTSQAWANWPLRVHFGRIKEMACAYADPESAFYRVESLKEAVCAGTAFWMNREWPNPNWWNVEMLPQQEMRYTALLMGEELPKEQTEFIIGILQDSVKESWTGANRVWFAENVMFKGILTGNDALVRHAAKAIMSTAECGWDEETASEDGIQPDGSFTQHGRLLYNNGYGAAWLDSLSFWIYQLRGLSFGAERAVYETAAAALLDGTAWMQRKGVIDPGTCGREISRMRLGADARIGRAAHRLLETARAEHFPRADELDAFEQYLNGNEEAFPEGNKMFWRVDYMSHRRYPFTATVRMLSRSVKGSESILNENKLGGFLSYGMTVFMRHGSEFFGSGREDGIFPVMDWAHLPGVTAPEIECSAAETNGLEAGFAGGVSDGKNGAAAMAYEKTIEHAGGRISFGGKKAYFFFDEGVVVLGAELHCDSPDVPLDTTLGQCRFTGSSYSDGCEYGAEKLRRVGRWVNHDSTGYVFFAPTEYALEQGPREGAWERITDSYPTRRGQKITRGVFKLYIRHGVQAENKTCAYMVLPGQSETKTLWTAANPPAEIIANDRSLQAVYFRNRKMTELVFYEPGRCSVHGELSVSADGRCILMVLETENGIKLYASDPAAPGSRLSLCVEYKNQRIEKTVVFPKGETYLGKTIEVI